MKRIAVIILALLLFVAASDVKTLQKEYLAKWAVTAQNEMRRTGVPASITLAQGMLESRYGQSSLASEFNNHFGIKCHKDWKGAKTYFDDDKPHECFRAYVSAEESFRDHSDFLRYQDRYKSLFELKKTDYKGWARGLKQAGYATDPEYAVKLIRLIEDLELYKYDTGQAVPEQTPFMLERPRVVDSNFKEEYRFPLSRPVYQINGVPFVYAMEGETYESIAIANNLFRKELLHFNDLGQDTRLDPGAIVYLQSKKSRAAKGSEKYVVGPDENITLRDVAQRFGVKESALIKLNDFPKYYKPEEGDTILLR